MTTLRLFGYRYTVVEDIDVNNRGLFGVCETDKLTIRLSVGMAPQQHLSVLIHEIVEAILDNLDIELPHNWVMIIETVVFQVLVDNWAIFAKHIIEVEDERKVSDLATARLLQ